MSSPGARSSNELTERQLGELRLASWQMQITPMNGNHRRTIASLVRKGYLRRVGGRYSITEAGAERVRGTDPTRSRSGW